MQEKYNILVTAIGGDIGQSVARALRRLNLVGSIIGTDISEDHPGGFFVDRCYTIPRADSPEFLVQLKLIVEKEKIDFVIPVSEPELKIAHRAQQDKTWDAAQLVIAQGIALPTCLDKFETIQCLRREGIVTPWTQLVQDGDPPSVPCILKDRWSWGSKSIVIIDNRETARWYAARRPKALFQELLLPDDEEYTCGIFRSKSGRTATIAFKRSLIGGYTGKAIVVGDKSIEEVCTRIAEALELRGSINVQLRKTVRGPILFEINPRFSSTVLFRELVGFRDVLWSLQDLLGQEPDLTFFPPVGTRIYRVCTEKIITTTTLL